MNDNRFFLNADPRKREGTENLNEFAILAGEHVTIGQTGSGCRVLPFFRAQVLRVDFAQDLPQSFFF